MLSLIIPTFNEKNNLEELIQRVENNLLDFDFEIIFVDDSTDDTPQLIAELSKNKSWIRLIHREQEKGLASAVVTGFQQAKGDILAVMDGDLQHPPELLSRMLTEIEQGADMVIPSRFIKGGSDGGLSPFRKLTSATARYLGKIILKSLRQISDPTGGIFMLKKAVIKNKDLDPVGWKILMEIVVLGDYQTLAEIPYTFEMRNSGESKFNFNAQIQYLWHLASLLRRSPADRRFYLFCLVGSSGVLIDMLVFILLNTYLPFLNLYFMAVTSSLSAMISNFIFNNLFTWSDRHPESWFKRDIVVFFKNVYLLAKYILVCSGGILVKSLILFLACTILGLSEIMGNLLGIICASCSNYFFSKWWVWGNIKSKISIWRS